MKIKLIRKSYNEVAKMPSPKRKKPKRQWFLLSTLVRIICIPTYLSTRFKVKKINMDKLKRNQPYLILMNHSSFIDLQIAEHILYPRVFNIVCTNDGFVGKNWLMRQKSMMNLPH